MRERKGKETVNDVDLQTYTRHVALLSVSLTLLAALLVALLGVSVWWLLKHRRRVILTEIAQGRKYGLTRKVVEDIRSIDSLTRF